VFLESLVPTLLIHVSVRRSTSLNRYRHGNEDRANSVPKKTLRLTCRANHGLRSNLPGSYPITTSQPCWHPTIKNSLTEPDAQHRDNTVIFGIRTGRFYRNQPSVAVLQRR